MVLQITKKMCGVLAIVFLIQFVVAVSDVAYVVKNENKVDKGFLHAFEEMGLSVDVIENDEIMETSFSGYKVVFIGDGTISHLMHMSKNLPIVLTNGKYAAWFGFLNHGVVKSIASNPELKIQSEGRTIRAYTSSGYDLDGPALSYSFLPRKNIHPDVEAIATTSTRRDAEIGVPIGYISGSKNKCFFGINKPQFWTFSDDFVQSMELFEDCVEFVMGSSDGDDDDDNGSGDDGDGDDGGDDGGTGNEQVHDVGIDMAYPNNLNGIRIHDETADVYLLDETSVLHCNQKYKVDYRTINSGDFIEDVNFSGSLATFSWTAKKTGLETGKTTTTGSKTITVSFAPGEYDLMIEATIPFADATPSDNTAMRKVSVVC
ncbi:MAG: hypothetical protein RL557_863 [archaeon]|jgi:hypothetical protein